ncbi:ABC transporter ATP-binding protein [Filobacillus milosensis]|uniref:ABC transporter ATP-binding protein n=1 Tax=Filobacillus milosensis TaxID=94137 RepID=A0A4Y8IEG9_9BACI|nr:ABC transporter ATP-binding protein [Filobacillus milosensis]TFB14600.1 ABC transporter ATP-binding protein [Filobacillus milosensis]
MNSVIELNNVSKTIDEFELGPLNMAIEPGLITAVVGSNGAGKSTFIKMLMNLVKPNNGQIRMLSEDIQNNEHWKDQVAYLPQRFTGYDPYTGKQLKVLISNFYPTWDDHLFEEIVEAFDVNLSKKFSKLSQGMQQKLALSLTIARNTDIMILDEPTSDMDIPSKQKLMAILVEWMERGNRSLIFASHQTDEIRKLADTIAIIQDGQMLGHFEKEELSQAYTQYWITEPLPEEPLPGEKKRKNSRTIITDNEIELELQLSQHQLEWSHKEKLDIEEAITLMLTI